MNIKLMAVVLVSATAALGSSANAQNATAYGQDEYGRSYAAPAPAAHRTTNFRGAYNQAPGRNQAEVESEFYNNGWLTEGALDHSRPGGFDPDFRPAE